MARKNRKNRTEQARAVKRLSRMIRENENALYKLQKEKYENTNSPLQIMEPMIIAPESLPESEIPSSNPGFSRSYGRHHIPDVKNNITEFSDADNSIMEDIGSQFDIDLLEESAVKNPELAYMDEIKRLRGERSILESFVIDSVNPKMFDNMGIGSEIPSTEKVVDLLGKVQDTIIGQKPKPELTDSVRVFSEKFNREEAVQCLLDVRKHIQKEELEASRMNRPISLNLAALVPFQRMLEVDEFLNAGLRSRDRDVRTWASYMKDELFKEANRRSMSERMEMLRELKPEEIKKLVADRSKASMDWLGNSEKQFGQLLGRPDSMFGVYLLASLLPIPGLLVLAGAVLPLGLSLTNMAITVIANERMKIVQHDKEGLAKLMLADSASSAVLRAMSETAEKEGLSMADVLNGYGTALADKSSIYHKVKEAIEYGGLHDGIVNDMQGLMEPIHRHNQKDGLDIYGFGVEKKSDGTFGATSLDPKNRDFAERTLSRLNESIYRSSLSDFLVQKEEGMVKAGLFASIRPVEAVMFISALRAGMYDSDRQAVANSLMNRCLPSLYDISEKNREDVINGILEQYGDCTRKYGRYRERNMEELKGFPMEYLIAGASMGRKEFHEALYDRFRTGDVEQLTTELMQLSDRIVHPHVKNIEEIVNVNSAAMEGNELKNQSVAAVSKEIDVNPMNMFEGEEVPPGLTQEKEIKSQDAELLLTEQTKTETRKETSETKKETFTGFER